MKIDTISMGTEFSSILELGDEFSSPEIPENSSFYRDTQRKPLLFKTIRFITQELAETIKAVEEDDGNEIVDGFGDLAFISLNGIYKEFRSKGFDHLQSTEKTIQVMYNICKANLDKRQPDGTVKKINGKVVKPEGWVGPDHSELFEGR